MRLSSLSRPQAGLEPMHISLGSMALWPALLNGVSDGTAKPPIAAQSASLRNKHMAWKFKRRYVCPS